MEENEIGDGDCDEVAQVCPVCKTKAVQKCSGCKRVFYCSREHQRKHWKEHSKRCKAFKLAVDDKVGRHYVATRKIEVDEVILREEEPLIAGPMHGTVPVCLGCYVVLEAKTAIPCKKCGWPLCLKCREHGPECEFTVRHKDTKVLISDYGYSHPTYRCICVIKALSLRETDPVRYQKLLNLEDHCDLLTKQVEYSFDRPLEIARFVKRFFTIEDVPEEEIARITGILQINGHEVPITEPPHVAVYDTASYLEHNCRANCSKSFTNNGGVIVRAAVPIAKGEHISICYTDPLWGVTNRRYHLARTKFFDCACERCQDPTEYGTMFNAILCTKEGCAGFMLPKTFLHGEQQPLPDYVCDTCQATESWLEVEQRLERDGVNLSSMKKDDVGACKGFIDRHSRTLHRHHFYLVDVKLALAQIIGQHCGGLQAVDDELLAEKIHLCSTLNELFKILVPAENRIRGVLLFEMHAALAEHGRRQGKEELRDALVESKKYLVEAYRLLRYEPTLLPEGQIALQARKNLEEMGVLLKTLCLNSTLFV